MRIPFRPRTQLGWMVALWLAGVAAMGVFAGAMHLVMAAVGLTP
ncbi:DUF2474 domain-containing protein [Gluconacetobacter azotocaptans]|uniref:DUF2474 domain-containing protein n=1 Tax=Gluconacetobacter azotocaptans TaxID=142834 RepID=A0A7W4JPR2_9PROT|nr:DUF2474 family protein [Gluconacetobacter azotocaptans]MBB2188495.1 DUF2474 domain-containing protein [Gluconacetobacter azotocaptans]MBM9400200.1 DUF2474 domain-containing protein [Gluconacetobacter azotocaptans]GBQ27998.1 hypothetical protein AA13594_0814 [Gluconacetobacter azotocaptans DSM 13594]